MQCGSFVYRPRRSITAFWSSFLRSIGAPLFFCASDKLHFVDNFHLHPCPRTGPFKDPFVYNKPTGPIKITADIFGLHNVLQQAKYGCFYSLYVLIDEDSQQSWLFFSLSIPGP